MAIANAVNGPESAPYLAKAGGTMAGTLNMGSQSLTGLTTPSANSDAASKSYVDTQVANLAVVFAARLASTGALTVTYDNGSSGVGATLTNAGAMAALSLDGVAVAVNDLVLIKNQASTLQNGYYVVTAIGSGAANWVLTRSTAYDTPSEINPGDIFVITSGSTLAQTSWMQASTVTSVGVDAITYNQFSVALPITVPNGGTGNTSATAYAVLCGGTTSSGALQSIASVGTSGQVLTSNGPGALPTMQDVASSNVNPNIIIGGNFDTNPWQRGTSFAAAANFQFFADRFFWNSNGGVGVVTGLKTADAPAVADAGILVTNCLHIDVTTADNSISATDFYLVKYNVEGYDWAQIAQRAFTLSFWVKAAKTGIHCVSFNNSGFDRYYVAEYTINVADTWEFKTITVSASPSAGTWNYTTGSGILITFALAVGTDFQGTADAWTAGGPIYATSNQVNEMDNTANNFKLALIKLEAGSTATDWQIRSEAEELALCQRYYTKTFEMSVAPAQNVGSNTGAITYYVQTAGATINGTTWEYPVTMRTTPTVTFYNPSAANANWRNVTDGADSAAAVAIYTSDRFTAIRNAQVAGDGAGENVAVHGSADAEI